MSGIYMFMNLIKQLKRHEGFEPDYYICTGGKKTIGYGRNVENNPFSEVELLYLGRSEFGAKPLTEDEAEYLLSNDVNQVIYQIQPMLPWDELSPARQAVCVNMAFNLGVTGFRKFKNMLSALNDCYYEKAAKEMLDSRWANQVGYRADELATQMATGEWQ